MKLKVTTEFGAGRVFISSVIEDEQWLRKTLGQAASGLSYLSFDGDTGSVVIIPAKVLETSIIEIIE